MPQPFVYHFFFSSGLRQSFSKPPSTEIFVAVLVLEVVADGFGNPQMASHIVICRNELVGAAVFSVLGLSFSESFFPLELGDTGLPGSRSEGTKSEGGRK